MDDFEKLNEMQKRHVLCYLNLSWISKEDFEKMSDSQREDVLCYLNLSWISRTDFEKLNNIQKRLAFCKQNLTWITRDDFEKLNDEQKPIVLQSQNLTWFTKEILGKHYKIHKKRTKEECLVEIKDYAEKYDLEFDGTYLFAYREHDQVGRGQYKENIFYKVGGIL